MLILRHSHVTAVLVNNDVQRRREDIDQKFALSKGYNASRLLEEFPGKGWTKRSINRLFQKLRETGRVDRRVDRRVGSGRPCSARMEENIDLVDDLIVSQEDKPQTHRTVREIARETGIPRSSVVRIIKKDLRLKCFKQ